MEAGPQYGCRTAPEVYDVERQVRILNEDGSFEMVILNEIQKGPDGMFIIDQQTGEVIRNNDLSHGKYDVTCSAGASFKNRQEQTKDELIKLGQVVPGMIERNADIFLNAGESPASKTAAERERAALVLAGVVPESQMTEEELQMMQTIQQQSEGQPDAAMELARAETLKAQADLQREELRGFEAQIKAQQQNVDNQLKAGKLQLDAERQEIEQQRENLKAIQDSVMAELEEVKKAAETLQILENIDAQALAAAQARITQEQQQEVE